MEQYGKCYKDMNRKEKIEHIWEYYRWNIFAVIVSILVGGSLLKTILFRTPPDALDIVVVNSMATNNKMTEVTEEYKEKFDVGLVLTNMDWNDYEMVTIMHQKIPLLLTADEMDIIGVTDEEYKQLMRAYGEDMFLPLEEIEGLEDILEKHKDNLLISDYRVDEKGNKTETSKHVYGIKLDKLSHMPCIDKSLPIGLGITPQVKDLDKAVEMFKYIVEDNYKIKEDNPKVEENNPSKEN